VLQQSKPDALLHVGFGGALQEGLKRGNVVVCKRLLTTDTESLSPVESSDKLVEVAMQAAHRAALDGDTGIGLTASRIVASPSGKEALGRRYGALVADLEAYWVGKVAIKHGVSFVSVRIVLDTVSEALPVFVQAFVEREGVSRWARVVTSFVTQPWTFPDAISLQKRSRLAADTLARFCTTLLMIVNEFQIEGGVPDPVGAGG
jgi:nucleoside phosphorylase